MKANHKLRTNREILLRNWRSNKNEHCDAHVPALRNLHTWTVPWYIYRLPSLLAKLLFTRQQSQDWWLTSWKQFGNANLEKLHTQVRPPRKKTEISAHPLWIAIRASKHQGQNWVEWSHRLLRAWSSWPYPARVPQENVIQDILASQFVQPHLTKHYLGESIKDHANHFVVYLLPNGLSAILTYNARNVQLQVVAYLDKMVLLGYVWVGKRDDR